MADMLNSSSSPPYPRNRKRGDSSPSSTLPRRIILVRHGESVGNADPSAYASIPDWKIPLTPRGEEQSRALGVKIKDIVGDSPLFIYCSPYLRTKQTLKGVVEALHSNHIVGAREEPRITEQQFGNFQNSEVMDQFKASRSDFGRFYYRFPEGEAGLDVYNRATSFIATMFRDWSRNDPETQRHMTVIVVTHGLTLRLFLMRWYQYTVREFEESINPDNGTYVLMERTDWEVGESDMCKMASFRMDQVSIQRLNLADRHHEVESSCGRQRLNDIIT